MEPVTMVLGGITISVISGAVVKIMGNNKVKNVTCVERRLACSSLLGNKIDNLANEFKSLKETVLKTVQ